MVGIQVCDYVLIRHRRIKLTDLYHPRKNGIYYFTYGINWRAFVSWVLGWAYLIPGFAHAVTPSVIVPAACTDLYYLAFPLGFAVSFMVHWGLNTLFPPAGLGETDDFDHYGTFSNEEAAKMGIAPQYLDGEEEVVIGEAGEKGFRQIDGEKSRVSL